MPGESSTSKPSLVDKARLAEALKAEALRCGFDLVGIAPAVEPTGLHAFYDWLAAGHAGTMEYLPRRADAYRHPGSVLEGVRSLVMLGINYQCPPQAGQLLEPGGLAWPQRAVGRPSPPSAVERVLDTASEGHAATDVDLRACPKACVYTNQTTSRPSTTPSSGLLATFSPEDGGEGRDQAVGSHGPSTPSLRENQSPSNAPAASLGQARVSRYAWFGSDYHDIIRERLSRLSERLSGLMPQAHFRGVIDTAPLLERDFSRLAGLGWFGKNTMLIHKRLGSWLFLAALLTDAELDPDPPHAASHCGTCTRCLEACPTDAFVEPYVLDARRCISYLTIEHRGPIAEELRSGIGDWLFGCDVCQDVCPWNRKSPASVDPAFQPHADLAAIDAIQLLTLTEDEFRRRFRHTPLWRPRRSGLLRNACLVLGNSGCQEAVPSLMGALNEGDPVIRGAAAWALGRLGGSDARAALGRRLDCESDATVLGEIQQALGALAPTAPPPRGSTTTAG